MHVETLPLLLTVKIGSQSKGILTGTPTFYISMIYMIFVHIMGKIYGTSRRFPQIQQIIPPCPEWPEM